MKVKTRPYRTFTVYTFCRKLFWFLGEESEFVDRASDWLGTFPSVLWAFDQLQTWYDQRRFVVKIDDWDTWNADDTIARISLPLLARLASAKQGAPHVDNEDVPEELRAPETAEPSHETDEKWFDRWNWVLEEIIWTLEQHTHDWDAQFYTRDDDYTQELLRENGTVNLDGLHFDEEGYTAHQKRMENGMRLFGKYFPAFWD